MNDAILKALADLDGYATAKEISINLIGHDGWSRMVSKRLSTLKDDEVRLDPGPTGRAGKWRLMG